MPYPSSTFNSPALPISGAPAPDLEFLTIGPVAYRIYNVEYDIGGGVGDGSNTRGAGTGVPQIVAICSFTPGVDNPKLNIPLGFVTNVVLSLKGNRSVRGYGLKVTHIEIVENVFIIKLNGPFGSVRV